MRNGQLDDASTSPLRLRAVRVLAPHTRESFLTSLLTPYLAPASSGSHSTLQTVLQQTRALSSAVLATGIFSSLEATLVPSPSPLARPEDVDLLLRGKSTSRYYLKGATDVGNGEGSVSVTGRVSSLTGGADTLSVVLSSGTRTRRAYEATYDVPLIGLARVILGARAGGLGVPGWETRTRAEAGVWEMERDWTSWAGCWERQTGARLGLSVRLLLSDSLRR